MTLPAYAEELKRLCTRSPGNDLQGLAWSGAVAITVCNNLDRILRDAEIAEACREWQADAKAFDDAECVEPWDRDLVNEAFAEERKSRAKLEALIAMETP